MNSETQSTSNTTKYNGSIHTYKILWKPTHGQMILLNSYYKKNRWPNDEEKAQIALDINIRFMAYVTMEQVGSWFEIKRYEDPQKANKYENHMKIYNNFSQEQQDYLISQFKKKKCPSLFEVKEIALKVHVDPSLIQTWYKNTRSLLKSSKQSPELSEQLKQYGFASFLNQSKTKVKLESNLNKRPYKIEEGEEEAHNCLDGMQKKLKILSPEDNYIKIESSEDRGNNNRPHTMIKEEEELNLKVEDYQDIPSAFGSEGEIPNNGEEQMNNGNQNLIAKNNNNLNNKNINYNQNKDSELALLRNLIADRRASEGQMYNSYNGYVDLGKKAASSNIVQSNISNNPFVVSQQPYFPMGNQIMNGNPVITNIIPSVDSPTPISTISMFNVSSNYYIFNMPSIPNIIMMNSNQVVSFTSSPSIQYSNTPYIYTR